MQLRIRLSVGRTGQRWDKAFAELFFSTLKSELGDTRPRPSRAAAHTAVFEWIESWYNLQRLPAASATAAPPYTRPPWQPDHHTKSVCQSGTSSHQGICPHS
ncbi:integrase core domain-containing protein [Streptomyces vinaceus]|uniref:integrase core domain-containing protein n=1 Tax=Streptomyces vinaceus TaxID=1960 RepID=UPI003812AABD